MCFYLLFVWIIENLMSTWSSGGIVKHAKQDFDKTACDQHWSCLQLQVHYRKGFKEVISIYYNKNKIYTPTSSRPLGNEIKGSTSVKNKCTNCWRIAMDSSLRDDTSVLVSDYKAPMCRNVAHSSSGSSKQNRGNIYGCTSYI